MQHFGPSDTATEEVELGGSVGKRRPVLQSVQLNDFNARFLEERWERATWRGSDSASSIACTPLRKSLSLSFSLSLSPRLSLGFFHSRCILQ